jgi:hypothetical protein
MTRFGLYSTLAVGVVIAFTGCGNSGSSESGLTTTSILDGGPAASGEVPAIGNEDPLARPVYVAWTSARAQRCGFYFDPAKLRTAYLAYEAKQGSAGEQLGRIEKAYDATIKTITNNITQEANYCSDRKSAEIKANLQRHLAGDYAPNFPKTKAVAGNGLFDWGSPSSNEPFDSKKFWQSQADSKVKF